MMSICLICSFVVFFVGYLAVINGIIAKTYTSAIIVFIGIINHFAVYVILRLLVL